MESIIITQKNNNNFILAKISQDKLKKLGFLFCTKLNLVELRKLNMADEYINLIRTHKFNFVAKVNSGKLSFPTIRLIETN